ncbi:flagellar hook-length control protein FliK [Arthrobacter sp. UKPF54-2]|uniref:flagellar hook-length control protein FliK n=1 Tax=Arthrobacter sp. UKPF54-2 TaxID=2600159 RepID=UPI001647249F|nr:flagellar hook-length control protein FliK [Arthrobacter sp. UKPF54-2]
MPAGVQAAPSAPGAATTPAGEKAGLAATAGVPAPAVPLPATSAPINGSSATTAMPAGVVGVDKPAGLTGRTPDAVPVAAIPADGLAAAGAAALAAPGPVSGPVAPGSATAPPAPAPSPAPQPALQPQLAKPLFTLAGAPHGQHIMTLKVTPEHLGPLTVRAHIDAAGVRIELFAPGDTGREALRGILPELRKELADAGFGASLDLSDHSGPPPGRGQDAGQDGGQDAGRGGFGAGSGPGGRNGPGEPRPGHRWDALADEASLRTARIQNGPQTTLDILV